MVREHPITKWLSNGNNIFPTIYLSLISFLTYACMYGIRKPFAVAEFQGIIVWGMDYKALLIISQVIGYALSKFLGIKIVSEMKRKQRAISIIMFAGMAELSLILFDIVPKPYNIIFLFLNGLPLGMIWGLVFAYLEGRKTTEILGTVLSISFIVSSGFVKSIGEIMITRLHLSDFQMPWVTGLVFFLPMLVLVWLLDKAPEPSREDIKLRSKRVPMDHERRLVLFREFAAGLIALTLAYMLLTIFRDLRDNFAVEIWKSIGYSGSSMIFTLSELPIAIIVFAVMSSVMLIRNNALALQINHLIVLSGFLTIGISTILLQTGLITPIVWMIMLGLGTYLGYLPFNCLLFDRLIAAFGSVANAGFFIYVADSFGYLGSVGTLVFKNFINKELSWFGFLVTSSFGVSIAGTMLIVFSAIYLSIKHNRTSRKSVVLEDLYIDTFTV